MAASSRREFLKGAAATAAAPAFLSGFGQRSPNETINVAVVGFHGRGRSHYRAFAQMPNVRVAMLCDVDERLFPAAVAEVEKLQGHKPGTEYDIRRLLERKDIDAVSIATPDHWHALMTIWACQAGKDVYVEKPVSFTIVEGKKMVEAARKYRRIVQAGHNRRSEGRTRGAMRTLHDGKLGEVYRARIVIRKPRASIGRVQESSIPEGVHWDLFLGPAPYRAFTLNRFHYGWHFFWDTSTTDIGNTAVHSVDVARWGLNKRVYPKKVHSTGGVYIWDSEQETPNVQMATFEYEDGTLLDVDLSNLYAPPHESQGITFYTSKGYLTENGKWESGLGTFTPRSRGPEVTSAGVNERATNVSFPRASYQPGPEIPDEATVSHFQNFIDCVRSRKVEDLYCDIHEGHLSAALCHMANISYRTGRKLVFDSATERFVDDEEANGFLTRKYREPYVLPDTV